MRSEYLHQCMRAVISVWCMFKVHSADELWGRGFSNWEYWSSLVCTPCEYV